MRDPLKVECARLWVLSIERERQNGYVINTLWFDQWLTHTQALRQPVGVISDGVVESNQGLGSRHTNLELNGEHGHARSGHRHDMLHASDLGEHLFPRDSHHLLDLAHGRAWEWNDDICHRDVDLRFLLARCDQDGEEPKQQAEQGKKWGDLGGLEGTCNAPGDAEGVAHRALLSQSGSSLGVLRDGLADAKTCKHLYAPISTATQPNLTQLWPSIGVDHVNGGELSAQQHRGAGNLW
jgi:hypothetical protein